MVYLASDVIPGSLLWLANVPDVLIILLCCVGACLAALPVARATGLVGMLGSRERRLAVQLEALAKACAGLAASRSDPTTETVEVPGPFRSAFAVLATVLERRLPAHETFAAASAELDAWLQARSAARKTPLQVASAGPAVALGTALGSILLMAEVWANPSAMSSGAALGIGLMVLVCILALSLCSSAANWLEEAERADVLASGVVIESARMIASGGSAADVSRRTELVLRPRMTPAELPAVRKAA